MIRHILPKVNGKRHVVEVNVRCWCGPQFARICPECIDSVTPPLSCVVCAGRGYIFCRSDQQPDMLIHQVYGVEV